VPNLGVLGASVMGTSGAHNPTLTAQALAWRSADHLTKNWKAIASGWTKSLTSHPTRLRESWQSMFATARPSPARFSLKWYVDSDN